MTVRVGGIDSFKHASELAHEHAEVAPEELFETDDLYYAWMNYSIGESQTVTDLSDHVLLSFSYATYLRNAHAGLRPAAPGDDLAARVAGAAEDSQERRAKQQVFWQQEAREEFAEARARDRMATSDLRFDMDARPRLGALWDEDPVSPTLLAMTNGRCLLYESARNIVFGPSESGKTFVGVLIAKQEMDAGRPVVYIDFENGPHGLKDRLKSFGVTREQADELFWYFDASGGTPPSDEAVERIAKEAKRLGGRVVMFDTTTPGMASLGLSPRDENDVETFYVLAGDPWVEHGMGWVTIDHTPNDNPGKALGSQQKKSGISGMALNVVAKVPFSRVADGYSDLYVDKDRHGGGPETTGEHRHVGQLHVIASRGVVEVRPVDAGLLAAQAAEKQAEKDAAEAMLKGSVKTKIRDWVRLYDDGTGLPHSWLKNSDRKGRVPRLVGAGVSSDTVMRWATEMLNDPDDPLVMNAKDRMVLLPAAGSAAPTDGTEVPGSSGTSEGSG